MPTVIDVGSCLPAAIGIVYWRGPVAAGTNILFRGLNPEVGVHLIGVGVQRRVIDVPGVTVKSGPGSNAESPHICGSQYEPRGGWIWPCEDVSVGLGKPAPNADGASTSVIDATRATRPLRMCQP